MDTFIKRLIGFAFLCAVSIPAANAQQNILRLAGVTVTASQTPNGSLSLFNDGDTGGSDVYYNTGTLGDSVWVQFQLPTPQVASTWQIYWWNGGSTYGANDILLYGSQDGTTWQLVNETQGDPPPLAVDFSNTTAWLYYRFVFKAYRSSSYLDFYEIELYNNAISAPTLTATSPIGSEVDLSWNAALSGTGSYEIQRSTDGTNFSFLQTLDVPATSYSDTGLTRATPYWYRIRGIKGSTTTDFSTVVKITTASDVLGVPTISANPGPVGSQAIISWGLTPFITLGSFDLERSTDGTNFTLLQTFDKTITSYTDTTLTRSTAYWYRVKAVNYASSSYSNAVGVTTISDSLLTPPSLSVTASDTIGTQALLTWSLPIALPGSFELERSTNGTDFILFKTVDKSITAYTDSTLAPNTAYWYRVRGRNAVSPSPYSDTQKITTRNDSLLIAPAIQATAPTGTQAMLSWNSPVPIAGNGGFEVDISTNGTDFILLGRFPKIVTAYTEESLTPNTSYWYRVRAYNYVNASPWSLVVSITTNGLTSAPADITNDGGNLYVNAENRDGAGSTEGSSKLIDNDFSTKWLLYSGDDNPGNLSAVYKPTGSYIVISYSLTTGGDQPPRDPRNWVFEGSLDSSTWVTLDTRTNQLGGTTPRATTFNYNLSDPGTTAFRFYRITFTANNGPTDGTDYQIAEWQIFAPDPASPNIPAGLTVTGTTINSAALSWTPDVSKPATKFVLQRSTDGLYFTLIDTLAGNVLTYTDTALYDSTNYYYRIQALGAGPTAVSGWSNVASALTKYTAGTPLTPTGLTADLVLTLAGTTVINTVDLTWTDRSSNETGFRIERSMDGLTFQTLDTLPANTILYVDSAVWPATEYYYRVAAINGQVASAYSNIDSLLTGGYNTAPVDTLPLLITNACSNTATITGNITGLAPGISAIEQNQTLSITRVSSADTTSANYFSSFSFVPAITNGAATYSFTGSGYGNAGDTATLIVTIKDNGGVNAGGTDSLLVPVTVVFTPLTVTISADKDTQNVPKYSTVQLTAFTNYPSLTPNYSWDAAPGIEGSRNNIILNVSPVATAVYKVTATSPAGCTASASITVSPDAGRSIGNVLTPNGDGKNDRWMIWGITANPNNSVKVFDRAGRLVFYRQNYSNDWDGTINGKPLDEGAYYYVVDYGDGQKPATGMLTIIRDHK
jgi:gliding motility-associated-like protein